MITSWPYPKIIAHRGGGTLAPENTIAAMRCGLEYGFHAVEFDVMLSKDGVPVLMHDPLFGRTVRGDGGVAASLAAELQQMDAGSWFSERFAGERIPTYVQVIEFCQQHRIWMNVEIKPVPGFEEITGRVVAEVTKQMQAGDDVLFSSFSFDALMQAKLVAPEIKRGFLTDQIEWDWQQRLEQLDAIALHTNHKHLTPEIAQQIKAAGYGLFCYTVNTPERAREIFDWGVDAFCTDRIDLIAADF
ncbi:glycerophosphodiester phosphodiesterase [Undibacterium sp. RTI2.1]|uniref:glycerophosphodiester phosphodiesterase n=1 Tax=unclassified Undibacterium TaxID=2630295 RepID=UPI002AB52EF9|nr:MULTISPECIES: glycerophosphodiester phosphodiesterase [unclassified Undibacterium]MDY7538594.1 glycerophosphodiester phosphodiesterase [Undibacterium sp. 5I1]MEB0031283.1 glycerophosphodiester phosphodiesterase [Undibacterium sp. RTI2.1]MEB0116325.1 glycerophosphodiester phosphodiesterase [Undibacterium sp. RTI2.2]MEB0231437.1 glycerophosphodiester phosphodiesterase [Undibacterium sp. 10I3]MEB0258096.1 glycerophosphodiester phosphodiesterase [Undibacterium sp. 5I1]